MAELLSELDSESLVLNLKSAIESSPLLGDYSVHLRDKTTLEVEIKKNEGVNTLFKLLTENKIDVLSMRNKSNRLEQLFLRLVESSINRNKKLNSLAKSSATIEKTLDD